MQFPETWKEFEANYGFTDSEEVYTNGARLIPSFRVEQWLEHTEPKRGKWISVEYNDGTVHTECSVCGYGRGLPPVRNYCPNCGAKMEKDEEQTL